MSVTKVDLGFDPETGIHTYEVRNAKGDVIGYDYVSVDPEE